MWPWPSSRAERPGRPTRRPAGRSAPWRPRRCATASASPATSPSPSATPEPQPLEPAKVGADPLSLLAFAFTPIFQGLFILLAGLYALTGNIVIAIMLMTVLIRLVTIRLSARQIISQKRMQILAPELKDLTKELQRRYKGDRQAVYTATQAFYKERGVSPTAGCLPSILQMGLLFPMYWVIRDGLTSYDPSAMLKVFGVNLVPSAQLSTTTSRASSTRPSRASTRWWPGSTSVSLRSCSTCRSWASPLA